MKDDYGSNSWEFNPSYNMWTAFNLMLPINRLLLILLLLECISKVSLFEYSGKKHNLLYDKIKPQWKIKVTTYIIATDSFISWAVSVNNLPTI